jgi:hypothetical protein
MVRRVLIISAAFPCLALTACVQPAFTGPTAPELRPGYVATNLNAGDLWEGVLDFLADTGADWRAWETGERFVQGRVLLSSGPLVVRARRFDSPPAYEPNPLGPRYADCGGWDQEPAAGFGDLRADLTVRVRNADGGGLLKVVLPRIWLEEIHGTGGSSNANAVLPCISTGEFEAEVMEAMVQRATPILWRGTARQ